MASVALREMMSVAREEAAIISSDAAMAARASAANEATAAGRAAGHEAFNPLAIREAAEASTRQAVGTTESSMLSALGHLKPGAGTPTTTISTSTSTVTNTVLSEAGAEASTVTTTATVTTETTVVGRVLEHDLGVTVREALTNAGETGAQEAGDQTLQAAQGFIEGHLKGGHVRAAAGAA